MCISIWKFFKSNRWIILWTVVILILSFIKLPPAPGKPIIPCADKIAHFALYLVLGILIYRNKWHYSFAWVYSVFLGGFVEILQGSLTNYRTADIYDFLSDMAGFAIGLYGFKLINKFKRTS